MYDAAQATHILRYADHLNAAADDGTEGWYALTAHVVNAPAPEHETPVTPTTD